MSTDLATEAPPTYRPLGEALRRLGPGRGGRPTHLATGIRWATDGVPLSDGSRLYLKAKRLPGRWVITDEALEEFVERLTADHAGQDAPAAERSPTIRSKAATRAARKLDALGI